MVAALLGIPVAQSAATADGLRFFRLLEQKQSPLLMLSLELLEVETYGNNFVQLI